jgi:hypothetical protein
MSADLSRRARHARAEEESAEVSAEAVREREACLPRKLPSSRQHRRRRATNAKEPEWSRGRGLGRAGQRTLDTPGRGWHRRRFQRCGGPQREQLIEQLGSLLSAIDIAIPPRHHRRHHDVVL